jgi:signal recognition particle subunit SRP54
VFGIITDSIKNISNKIRFKDDISALNKALVSLKKTMLKSDLHHKTTKELITNIELETKKQGIGQKNFTDALKKELLNILDIKANQGFVYAKTPLTTILLAGLQGSGKTTTTAKLALYLKNKNKKVLIVACDTQRLAAVEQLKQLCSDIEVDLYSDEQEKNPSKIAKAAKQKATKELYDVLLVDTAGRLAIDKELMSELKSIKKSITPDETFYVADMLTGHDATRTADSFHKQIGLEGVILTKFDGDTKGGVALSIAHQVGLPLRFVGTGEHMPDIEPFIPERIVSRLMGQGDMVGLAEKTATVIDEKKLRQVKTKIKKGEFNFDDFLDQMNMLKKMGSMKSMLGMIPGMGKMASQLGSMDIENSSQMKNIKALISSMTKKERQQPSILNPSRKNRISSGAGLSIQQTNRILKQFKNASKMAKKMSGKSGKAMKDMLGNMEGKQIPK